MLDPNNLDFIKLGFHAGLEVHHQIKSDRKLFCNCPPILEDDPEAMEYSFFRYFRPVLGEMGDFDPGMLVEFEKNYKVIYFACERNTCTYEMDETPPFVPDDEAIRKGFLLSAYFNCSAYAEEIVVNRKQYLDGSITTGFQRTFICGRDGWVPVNGKKVRVTNVHIEEDAARRVNWIDTSSRTVYFNLDRLGIPLTEVITEYTDVDTPEELIETAKQIGRVLRLSRVGRRGIGSARQDVNITIEGGDRVEVKGVQDLHLFDLLCRHEVVRQHALIEIMREMKRRGIKKEDYEHTYIDISHVLNLESGSKAFASVFPKMKGIFGLEVQPNKDFGLEIFEKSMLITGIPREYQFHSDQLEDNAVRNRSDYPCKVNISQEDYQEICSILNPDLSDAVVVVVGPERKAIHCLKKIVERVKIAVDGVPQETRRFIQNGNTEFLRVIHGKDRIYPDTDTPPIVISLDKIQEMTKNLKKRPWEVFEDLNDKYGFSQDQIDLLIRDEKVEKFYDYTETKKIDANLAYRLLIDIPREKRRSGVILPSNVIDIIAEGLEKKDIIAEQIGISLKILLENPNLTSTEVKAKLGTRQIPINELEEMILSKLKEFRYAPSGQDERYSDLLVPKVVGVIIKDVGYAYSGEYLVEAVRHVISKQEDE
ncbi:MAG: Glu-tRNA(Gln) amidotransferase subunit GatE [Candidatus Heimdallarchaeaceae archaeon]|jgi:glutamyl-tRNA(Gln) amidotransferase subunit E